MTEPTIAGFLHERITTTSARAHTALEADPAPEHSIRLVDGRFDVSEEAAPFSVRWLMTNEASPQDLIRACTAKARVLARHPGATAEDECPGCGADHLSGRWITGPGELCPELQDMASAYSGHPDYREEWKPKA